MKIVKKPKKPKLDKALRKNLLKAQELLTRVQTLVEQGKRIEDPEIQEAIRELAALTEDVKVARNAMAQALSKVMITKRMMGRGFKPWSAES